VEYRTQVQLLPVDVLAITLEQLGIDLNVHAFIDLVNQKAVLQAASSRAQMSRKDAHKGKQYYNVIISAIFDTDWQISLQLQ
jgi:hypothetical protein